MDSLGFSITRYNGKMVLGRLTGVCERSSDGKVVRKVATSEAVRTRREQLTRSESEAGETTKVSASEEIGVPSLDATRFDSLLDPGGELPTVSSRLRAGAAHLDGRAFWHINSTAAGGGDLRRCRSVLRIPPGGRSRARWPWSRVVRLLRRDQAHSQIAFTAGTAMVGQLGGAGASSYELTSSARSMTPDSLVRSGDVVVLHDPQTLGLAPHLRELGASVI